MTVVLSGVTKDFGADQRAVEDVSLTIHDGEFFTLLGPSGCGKTTTLRMIAGLETTTAGSIWIRGRDVSGVPARERDVAMVFQSYALYPHMSVYDNLALNLKVKKVAKAEIKERVQSVAQMLRIDTILDRKPGQLSGGQRQRVALGRAIIRRPNVFLMDEPLSNLDLKLREETRTELKKLHEDLQITTVYVTHDQSEALVLSDRIGVMNEGRLLQVGDPHEVYANPADVFVARFIGSPSINLIDARFVSEDSRLYAEIPLTGTESMLRTPLPCRTASDVSASNDSDLITIGVRPEDLAVVTEPGDDRIPAVVDFTQPMGSVSYIIFRIDGDQGVIRERDHLVAAVPSDQAAPARGTKLWLKPKSERISVFNRKSGEAIAWGNPE